MTDIKHDLGLRAAKVLNIALIAVPFAVCWYRYYAPRTYSPFYNRGNWVVIALFVLIYMTYCKVYDAFMISISPVSEILCSQVLAAGISDGILYFIVFLLARRFLSPLPLLQALVCQTLLATLWTFSARRWYFAVFPPKRTAVIYDSRPGLDVLLGEYGLKKKFDIRVTADAAACLRDPGMLEGMEAVFLSGIHSHDRNVLLKYCVKKDLSIYVIPRIGDTIMSGAKQTHMLHLPLLNVCWHTPPAEYLILKRIMDIVIAGAGLVAMSPVMAAVAVAIRLTDGGPVFYRQKRLTKNGREFEVLKFRSMKVDAEKDGIARLSAGSRDERVTPVGRIIRRCRIDELPQLFNVLRGDMSIVGPRPERPEIVEQYMKELPEFALRLKGKAGLTGYAQVYGKYNTQPYDKLQMDLMYLSHPSIMEDLRIMFSTAKILFMLESTEGIAAGETTAARDVMALKAAMAPEEAMEPKVTGMPEEAMTLKAVRTPEETMAPKVTRTLERIAAPKVAMASEEIMAPKVTGMPEETIAPEKTMSPLKAAGIPGETMVGENTANKTADMGGVPEQADCR